MLKVGDTFIKSASSHWTVNGESGLEFIKFRGVVTKIDAPWAEYKVTEVIQRDNPNPLAGPVNGGGINMKLMHMAINDGTLVLE